MSHRLGSPVRVCSWGNSNALPSHGLCWGSQKHSQIYFAIREDEVSTLATRLHRGSIHAAPLACLCYPCAVLHRSAACLQRYCVQHIVTKCQACSGKQMGRPKNCRACTAWTTPWAPCACAATASDFAVARATTCFLARRDLAQQHQ